MSHGDKAIFLWTHLHINYTLCLGTYVELKRWWVSLKAALVANFRQS